MKNREKFPPEIQCKTAQKIQKIENFTKNFLRETSLKVKIKNEKK